MDHRIAQIITTAHLIIELTALIRDGGHEPLHRTVEELTCSWRNQLKHLNGIDNIRTRR